MSGKNVRLSGLNFLRSVLFSDDIFGIQCSGYKMLQTFFAAGD